MKQLVLLGLLLAAACTSIPATPTDTGIEGQVFVGSMCPVLQAGAPCPDQPYQATLTVLTPNGGRVLRFDTDAEGRFHTPLAAGEYILRPETPDGMLLPVAAEQPFTVVAGRFTQLMVTYDSGIR